MNDSNKKIIWLMTDEHITHKEIDMISKNLPQYYFVISKPMEFLTKSDIDTLYNRLKSPEL